MRRMILLALLLGTALPEIALADDAAETAAQDAKLQQRWVKLVESRGYPAMIDADGDVTFKVPFMDRELTFFIDVTGEDPTFFRVVLANLWPVESPEEGIVVTEVANQVTSRIKVAKAYVTHDNLWLSAEVFVDKPARAAKSFDRMVEVVLDGLRMFLSVIEELTDE